MTETQWHDVAAPFLTAVELPPRSQEPYAADACGADGWLRSAIDTRLRTLARGTFSIGTAVAEVAEDFAKFLVRSPDSARVKANGLIDLIDQSGAGTVHLAGARRPRLGGSRRDVVGARWTGRDRPHAPIQIQTSDPRRRVRRHLGSALWDTKPFR